MEAAPAARCRTGQEDAVRDPALAGALDMLGAGRVRTALDLLDRMGTEGWSEQDRAVRHAAVVSALLARGALTDAVRAAEPLTAHLAARADAAGDRPDQVSALAHHARAELTVAVGDLEGALDHLAAMHAALPADGLPGDLDAVAPWPATEALVLVRAGRPREALEVAVAWHERAGTAYERAHALRTLAGVESGGPRVPRLREARVVLHGVPADRLAAQIDTDLAGLLILHGAPSGEVLGLLRSAEEYAGREELAPLQGRVRWLLERLGEEPRPVASEVLSSLTAGEHRVARLAAHGLSNREIAAQLVVSVKAVEWHLSHVYRKLGMPRQRLGEAFGVPA